MEAIGVESSSSDVATSRAGINQEDFLKVLLAQMQFQDPLEPMENQEFMAQFAQLTNLEQTQQFNDKLDSLLSLQSSGQAINLIGKSVEANINSGQVVGEVTSVAFSDGSPFMTVKTLSGDYLTDVSLGQIRIIR